VRIDVLDDLKARAALRPTRLHRASNRLRDAACQLKSFPPAITELDSVRGNRAPAVEVELAKDGQF